MPTSTEVVREKREAEAWEDPMRQIRAAEAARTAQQQPAPEPEKKDEPSDG